MAEKKEPFGGKKAEPFGKGKKEQEKATAPKAAGGKGKK